MPDLPPLNAMRSFECAARCGGFVLAGQELGVSSAAVSLQVKNLETFLGKELFLRRGNRILLTDAGEAIYPRIADALNQLNSATQFFQNDKPDAEVVISVMPSLSELWLLPKLALIRDAIDVPLDIRIETDPVNFGKSNVDLRLTYGTRYYEDYLQTKLFKDVIVPTCTRAFWDEFAVADGSLDSIPSRHLIHHRWGPAFGSEPTWEEWFHRDKLKHQTLNGGGLSFNQTSFAIAAARRGLGVALAPKGLIKEDLERGRLITPSEREMPMQYGYYAICTHSKGRALSIKKVLAALLA
jgi:LysR family glycine cleavage system transcriptional activator